MNNGIGSGINSTIILDGLSSDVTKAYAWIELQKDERDERLDEQGADRTAQCLRSADGVFRAPLAVFVERGEYVKTAEDIEEEENDVCDLADDEAEQALYELTRYYLYVNPLDYYAQLADHLGIEEDGPALEYDDYEPANPAPSGVLVSNHESNNPRFRHLSDGKTIIRLDNRYLERDRKSWKATTPAPKQSQRHA